MSSSTTTDGRLDQQDDRWIIRFERTFHHSIEKVFDALTQPARLAQWWGDVEVDIDLVAGGAYTMRTLGPPELVDAIIAEHGDEVMLVTHNTVLRVEPPRVFEHTFHATDSIVRWELESIDDGACRVRLTYTEAREFAPFDAGSRDLAGWHALFEGLERALDGAPEAWRRDRWEELRDAYAA